MRRIKQTIAYTRRSTTHKFRPRNAKRNDTSTSMSRQLLAKPATSVETLRLDHISNYNDSNILIQKANGLETFQHGFPGVNDRVEKQDLNPSVQIVVLKLLRLLDMDVHDA
jgi:hypothetical protein